MSRELLVAREEAPVARAAEGPARGVAPPPDGVVGTRLLLDEVVVEQADCGQIQLERAVGQPDPRIGGGPGRSARIGAGREVAEVGGDVGAVGGLGVGRNASTEGEEVLQGTAVGIHRGRGQTDTDDRQPGPGKGRLLDQGIPLPPHRAHLDLL
jgi:hypothetical protein